MKLFRFNTDNYINAGVNICLKLVSEEVVKIYYIYYHLNKQSYRKVSSSVLQDILRILPFGGRGISKGRRAYWRDKGKIW